MNNRKFEILQRFSRNWNDAHRFSVFCLEIENVWKFLENYRFFQDSLKLPEYQ